MSPHTDLHAPRTSRSKRIQIRHKNGFIIIYFLFIISIVNIKPPRHRFGLSLAWDALVLSSMGLALLSISLVLSTTHGPLVLLYCLLLHCTNGKQPLASLAQFYQRNLAHYKMAEDDDNEGEQAGLSRATLEVSYELSSNFPIS
jgi:hypothetical protein